MTTLFYCLFDVKQINIILILFNFFMGQVSQKSPSNSLKSQSSQKETYVSILKKEDIDRINRRQSRQRKIAWMQTAQDNTSLSATKQYIDIVKGKYECPNSLIGYLCRQLDQRSQYLGSCFFIMENLVVTSAHQLPNQREGDLIVYIPKDNKGEESKKYFTFAVKNTILNNFYGQYRQQKYDYAFLQIKQPQNTHEQKDRQQMSKRIKELLFFDYKQYENSKFSFLEGINYGFIEFIPSSIVKTKKIDKFRLLCSKGSIYYYNGEFLEYDAYTINGMSGGPIFIQNQERVKVLIGMHSYGNCHQEKNYGLLFGSQFYEDLNKLAQSYKNLKIAAAQTELIESSQGLNHFEQDKINKKLKKIAQSYEDMSFKGKFQKVQVDMYIALQDKIKEIKKKSIEQQIEDVGQILKQIFYLLKKLQNAQIYVKSLKDSDIVLYREEWRIKSAQLCYNPLDKVKRIIEQNSVIFLKKYLSQNTFINQIKESNEYQQSDSKLKGILNSLQQKLLCVQDYFFQDYDYLQDQQSLQIQKEDKIQWLPPFHMRVDSFIYLIKYSSKKLTSKSFLRIYMTMIMEIIHEKANQQIKKKKDFSFFFKGFSTQYQQQQYNNYKKIYQQKFKQQQVLNKQDLIQALVKYQIIFIDNIYKTFLYPVYRKQKNPFNYDYNLYEYSDSLSQNAQKFIFNKQINYRNINQIFFNQYETKQHIYKMTKMTEDQQRKYKYLTEKIVGIIGIQNGYKIKGTGFIIDEDLIITALHVLGDIEDSKHLNQRLKKYLIKYKDQLLEIQSFYPTIIKSKLQRLNAQNTKYDIIILKIKNKFQDFKDKIAFMQIQNQEKSNKTPQRHAALLIGLGEEQQNNKKTIIFKKSIGQICVLSSSKNYFIPLQGQKDISGSPIIMFTEQGHPIIVGIYTSPITNDQQNKRYGVYEKLNRQYFKEIQTRYSFKCSKNHQFSQDFYNEYIKQAYVTYDHFFLRLIAQILKLNHYHFYLKSLKMSNLILNIENSPNILFNDLQLVRIDEVLNQQTKFELFFTNNQKRDMMKEIFKECQIINFTAFKQFSQKLLNKSWVGAQSHLIKQIQKLNIKNYPSLKSFFTSISNQLFQAIGKNLSKKWSYEKIIKQAQNHEYHNIYQRHFIHKPRYRLDRLIMSQNKLMSDKGKQYGQSQFKNTQRSYYIQKYMQEKQSKLIEITNKTCMNFDNITLLYQIFKTGASKLLSTNLKQQIKHNKASDRQRYKKQLRTYTNGIIKLTKRDLQDYQKEQLKQFDESYENIIRWTMIEEILQYFDCLDRLQSLIKGRGLKEENNK